MADAVEPRWQNVEQKAPDELVGGEGHRAKPLPPVAAVILVAEGYAARVEADQPAISDGNAMGVAGEIGEHRFGPGEGRLGIDEPFLLLEWCEVRGEGLAATQAVELAEEHQPARRASASRVRKSRRNGAGQHAHR